MKKVILVIGASRGIGANIVKYFSTAGHELIGVSRTHAPECRWIKADISTASGIQSLLKQLDNIAIDVVVYSSGVWEKYGFTDEFDFRKTSDVETRCIMSVNVVAPIEITKGLTKNLSLSLNPRAIYLGALSGVDQRASSQVAYSASKFALRGAIQALRMALKENNIGFTTINPGNVATEEVLLDMEEGRFKQQALIPISDITSSIEWLLSLSNVVEVGDINLMQKVANKPLEAY